MAIKQINSTYYQVDTKEDLKDITGIKMGMEAYVIKEACEYAMMSTGEWVKQIAVTEVDKESTETTVDLTGYATEDFVKEEIGKIEIPSIDGMVSKAELEELKATMRPIKYEITGLPKGAMVDYRDKEIRVFCPEGTEFVKQNVGANGVPNMYYMTFKAYAPEGAVSFKEGDRGVIVDEMFDFNASAAGTDKYGRNYSVCWLALASLDESAGTWSYFGKGSNIAKYIGWTYVVEWYDKDGNMIDTDKIRINLSNAECHLALDPYYG